MTGQDCIVRRLHCLNAQGQDASLGWGNAQYEEYVWRASGRRLRWPKNILHWHGIHESVVDVCATVPIHFVIADAVVCMEGNGPLNGRRRELDRIVLADDPVAADATCMRLMGLQPERILHISKGSRFLGRSREQFIDILGEKISAARPFYVLPDFHHLIQHAL